MENRESNIESKLRIGELLVKLGHLEEWQLEKALEKQKEDGGLIGEVLVSLGFIKDKTLIDALTTQASEVD